MDYTNTNVFVEKMVVSNDKEKVYSGLVDRQNDRERDRQTDRQI